MFLGLHSGNESLAGSLVRFFYAKYVNNCRGWLYEEAIEVGLLEVSVRWILIHPPPLPPIY